MFSNGVNWVTIFVVCCAFINIIAKEQESPQETQKAECTVTAGEVKATAEATTTRTLKGICGSVEMNLAFENLERKLLKELQEIKNILYDLHPSADNHNIDRNLNIKASDLIENSHNLNEHFTTDRTTTPTYVYPKDTNRHLEIRRLNNTVLTGSHVKIFSYYWKVDNFSNKINESSIEESPIFTIFGKPLRVKASYNHLQRDFLFLKLEFANFNNQDTFKNIILDTGTLFQKIEQSTFKHKISILDQVNPSNDLISQEFSSLDKGFLIPNSALLFNPYSKNNSLLIKIFLYL